MKRLWSPALILCICLLLSGCDYWYQSSYIHVSPHKIPSYGPQTEKMEVSNYEGLLVALTDLVEDVSSGGTIFYPKESAATVKTHMEAAIQNVLQTNPIAGYAVEEITFEVGQKSSVQAVAVNITYHRNTSDVRRLSKVESMQEAAQMVYTALDRFDVSTAFYVSDYKQTDFVQLAQDYVDRNPDVCMEMPQVTAAAYPQEGQERIVEVVFSYQNSREDLRNMQKDVADIFESAQMYVSSGANNRKKYEQLYSFIMLNYNNNTLRTSITPSYSLLKHGVGDSKAYATVYAAMCAHAGLNCSVITGTKDAQVYYWNAIEQGDGYVFVDLLDCAESGRFSMRRLEKMKNYVWDYSAYPGQ